MKAINRIIERARTSPRRIVLCEAEDPRMLEAAQRATRDAQRSVKRPLETKEDDVHGCSMTRTMRPRQDLP